jgi:integrase
MGDQPIGAIDRDIVGEYFNILRKLPANITRVAAYRDKTIPQILELKAPPQSESNVSKKMERLSTMFQWATGEKRTWGIDTNPFKGFGQSGSSGEHTRRPFTNEELKTLLEHPSFTKRVFNSSYSYWAIPLALFTGARLGELAQLDLKDFVKRDEIDCIDINDIAADNPSEIAASPKKSIKTINAKRLVPLHPELIRLGILRHVNQLREEGQTYLFPELNRARRDGPGQAISNWFQRFRARVGITNKHELVFHSFRHLFITKILDAGVSPHMLAPIVGHEAELITGKVYWNKNDAQIRKSTVDLFTLQADLLKLIPSIEEVKFKLS